MKEYNTTETKTLVNLDLVKLLANTGQQQSLCVNNYFTLKPASSIVQNSIGLKILSQDTRENDRRKVRASLCGLHLQLMLALFMLKHQADVAVLLSGS